MIAVQDYSAELTDRQQKRFDDVLNNYRKVCACCGKPFYIQSAELYTFKIHAREGMLWYCKWSCFSKGTKKTTNKQEKQDEYLDKAKERRKKYNQKGRRLW